MGRWEGHGKDVRCSVSVRAAGICSAARLCGRSEDLRWASPLGTKLKMWQVGHPLHLLVGTVVSAAVLVMYCKV